MLEFNFLNPNIYYRTEYAQYKELAAFSQFGSDLSQDTVDRLNHGERIMEVLKQPQYRPMQVEDQVLILFALNKNFLEDIEIRHIRRFQNDLIHYFDEHAPHIKDKLRTSGKISEELEAAISEVIKAAKENCSYI